MKIGDRVRVEVPDEKRCMHPGVDQVDGEIGVIIPIPQNDICERGQELVSFGTERKYIHTHSLRLVQSAE